MPCRTSRSSSRTRTRRTRTSSGSTRAFPLTERDSGYAGVLPDKIEIYRLPLEEEFGHDPELLVEEIRITVVHELAHHFGIDDDRLDELGWS